MESLASIRTAVMDKTGTLTEGSFRVSGVSPADGIAADHLVNAAAAAETYSTHPIANALREYAGTTADPSLITEASDIAGQGVRAVCGGSTILAGNSKLMKAENIAFVTESFSGTTVYVAENGQFLGSIRISDGLWALGCRLSSVAQGLSCRMALESSQTKDQAYVPCIVRQILILCTTREVLDIIL